MEVPRTLDPVNLALTEMKRAKLRFGLLTAAVALLVFLIVFLSSLSGALLRSFTGAVESLPADGLVYSEASRANIQASRLDPSVTEQVSAVEGVSAVGPLAVLSANAEVAGTVRRAAADRGHARLPEPADGPARGPLPDVADGGRGGRQRGRGGHR